MRRAKQWTARIAACAIAATVVLITATGVAGAMGEPNIRPDQDASYSSGALIEWPDES